MKKALIAGAASTIALAAMPMAGVFAVGPIEGSPIVDEFTINVTDACTFSRKVTSGDMGHPAGTTTGMTISGTGWTEGTVAAEDLTDGKINGAEVTAGSDKDTFTASVVAGNTYNGFAKSAFNVTCNNAVGGYKVTSYAGNLAGTGSNSIAYNSGQYAQNGSSWYFTSAITNSPATTGSTTGTLPIVWQHTAYDANNNGTAKLASDDFEITYNLQVALDQAVDTYTGSVVYALTNLN